MKKYFIGFIIGCILCTSIGVFATLTYEASQINYKGTTLDHAIDDLYDKIDVELGNVYSEENYGSERPATSTASKELPAGNYICNAIWVIATTTSTTSYLSEVNSALNVSGCDYINTLDSGTHMHGTSNKATNETSYKVAGLDKKTFQCNLNSKKTITVTRNANASSSIPYQIWIDCVELIR